MKKLLTILFTLALIFSLNITAFAVDTVYSSGDDTTPDIYITNEISTVEDLGEYVGTSVYALNPIEPSDASGLKAVLLEVIGPYDAIVVEHSYENTNGYTSYVREIQYDYPWLCSCGLFVVVLFCILRGGFAVLCKL